MKCQECHILRTTETVMPEENEKLNAHTRRSWMKFVTLAARS